MALSWMEDLHSILDSCQQQLEQLVTQVRRYLTDVATEREGLEQEKQRLRREQTTIPGYLPETKSHKSKQIHLVNLQQEQLSAGEERLKGLVGRLQDQVDEFGDRASAIHELTTSAGGLVVCPGGLLDRFWIVLRSWFLPSVPVWAVLIAATTGDSAEAAVLQLYEWERDRLLTLAKGAGGAAVTVLAGLLATGFGGKTGVNSVTFFVAAPLVGILLLWGGFVLAGLRSLAEQYPVALELVRQ